MDQQTPSDSTLFPKRKRGRPPKVRPPADDPVQEAVELRELRTSYDGSKLNKRAFKAMCNYLYIIELKIREGKELSSAEINAMRTMVSLPSPPKYTGDTSAPELNPALAEAARRLREAEREDV